MAEEHVDQVFLHFIIKVFKCLEFCKNTPNHDRFLMSKNRLGMSRNALVNQFRIVFEKPLPLSPFLVARVGKRGWRSKSLWRKKSRRKLCARAPWSDRWVPAKILEMYRCHVNITVRICKDVFEYNFSCFVCLYIILFEKRH